MSEPYIAEELVNQLVPPVERDVAVNALTQTRRQMERTWTEQRLAQAQGSGDARKQLRAARAAMEKLGPRAAIGFCRQLDRTLAEQLPHRRHILFPDGEPKLGEIQSKLWEAVLASLDRAHEDITNNRRGEKGVLDEASMSAVDKLVRMYCFAHEAPAPSYDSESDDCRHPEAARFAWSCLLAWNVAGADGTAPSDQPRPEGRPSPRGTSHLTSSPPRDQPMTDPSR
jgi:hypothetical protein